MKKRDTVTNSNCDVKTGPHSSIFWKDKITGLKVCSRHRVEHMATHIGPFDWVMADV